MEKAIKIHDMAKDLTFDENIFLRDILEEVNGDIQSSIDALCDGEYLETIDITETQTENICNYLNELIK